MECLQITGGVPLKGRLAISGAKNAVLPLMTLSLLTDQPLILDGVPRLADVQTMKCLLQSIGTQVDAFKGRLVLHTPYVTSSCAHYDIVRRMRASIVILGPLLARYGKAEISLPGGCTIGPRPVNYHCEGLQALGANISLVNGYIHASLPKGKLQGGQYAFPQTTVTGTMNLLLAATMAAGETCLQNAACEPEICDLIDCLTKMGALIEGKGTPTLLIQGGRTLKGVQHQVLPDRIEMGTYIMAAAITRGDIILEGGDLSLLPTVVEVLQEIGITFRQLDSGDIWVQGQDRWGSITLHTNPFPGFPTDLQAQMMALLSLAEGQSTIVENIFENRFMHVSELRRMGAHISVEGKTATIQGVKTLSGAPVMATDLRASVSLVLAALAAEGTTLIRRIYHLDRGYEALEEKLSSCGADICRFPHEESSDILLTPLIYGQEEELRIVS